MNNKKKIGLFAGALALMSASLFSATYAWFATTNQTGFENGKGYTASAYFAGGNGSEATPYIINQPIHFYNLAWLQYLGYFNQNENGAYKQTYFVLGSDIDMSSSTINWTLPPIGTTDNPFIGNFDGKGYTISNLVVDNTIGDGHITRKPSAVSSITGVNIVGTFGVVGAYNLSSSYTYSSAVNTVKNVRLNNAEVRSSLTSTLIGVAAGYVDAALTDVGIVSSKITVASGSTALSGGPTTNISDYSTIGYCTANYKKDHLVTDTTIKAPSTSTAHFTAPDSGDASGWGGSIDMKSMYNRLVTFRSRATNLYLSSIVSSETKDIDVNGNVTTTVNSYYSTSNNVYFKQYYDSTAPLKGSYSFCKYSTNSDSTTYLYLYGKKDFTKTVTTNTTVRTGTYKNTIASSGNYLITDGSYLTAETTSSTATNWTYPADGQSGTISATVNGTLYYIYNNTSYGYNDLGVSSYNSTTFTRNGNYLTCTDYNGNTAYLYYYDSSYGDGYWDLDTTASALTFSSIEETTTTTATETKLSASTYDTYYPLNVDTNNLPIPTNTGYVVSGSSFSSSNYTGASGSGDIRVSQYSMGDLYRSLNGTYSNWNGGSATYSDAKLEIATRTENSGSFVRISDTYNASNNAVQSEFKKKFPTKTSYSTLGLTKYAKSRASLSTLLSGQTSVYGLHFMQAAIDANDFATAAKARINKVDYENYPLPRNSIDFYLHERGYINFFSGTYFSGNTSFFSLHKITRDTNKNITSIKQISKVYGVTGDAKPFIYLYSDGTYSATLTSDYSERFDMAWITSPTMLEYSLYYFEIPVNDGEYALGSVSNKDGAYLIYLDISANAQEVNRTIVTEYILSTTNTYEYPLGVALLAATTDAVDPLTGVAVGLSASYSGTMSLSKTGTTISLGTDNNNFSPGFKGDTITLARTGSSDPPTLVPKSSKTDTIKRLTYIDYNATTEATTYTVITDTNGTLTYTDGNGTAITSFTNSSGTVVNTSTLTSIDVSALTTTICDYWYSYAADSSTITATFVFTHTQDTSNTTLHVDKVTGYTITVKSTSEAVNITVTVKDGNYVITINGTTITVGTVVAVPVTTA